MRTALALLSLLLGGCPDPMRNDFPIGVCIDPGAGSCCWTYTEQCPGEDEVFAEGTCEDNGYDACGYDTDDSGA